MPIKSWSQDSSLLEVTIDMKPYAIHWKCSVTGRLGTGTMRFNKKEAEGLVKELNEKYPNIDHEAVIPPQASTDPAATESIQSLSS